MEQVKKHREIYLCATDKILAGMPELLRWEALLWHRNYRDEWRTWEDFIRDFRQQYFPPRYIERLRREILERRQSDNEKFAQYVNALTTLMRRAGGYDRAERLERVYANMRPEYKRYIK